MWPIPIDVHLMVEPVDALIPLFAAAGANIITFHPEASRHVDRTLGMIRECGCKAGLAFNPATPLFCWTIVMDKVDMVLLMSVNPGFGGQFIAGTWRSCRRRRMRIDAACGARRPGRSGCRSTAASMRTTSADPRRRRRHLRRRQRGVRRADEDGGYHGILRRLRRQALERCKRQQETDHEHEMRIP
jgi:ribulose-phosphate 3-epimerase